MPSDLAFFTIQELERKSNVKLNVLLDIEKSVQKQWYDNDIFEVDAPKVSVYMYFILVCLPCC